MASLVSHAIAALGIAAAFYQPQTAGRVCLVAGACSIFPDSDVLGLALGIGYGEFWGYRGFTHSLFFAALLASLTVLGAFRVSPPGEQKRLWFCFFLATASHGLLDAMTDGGLGVAFFSPLDTARYFLPWRPIPVSPIGVARFLSPRGLAVLRGEVFWIWLPAAALVAGAYVLRRFRGSRPGA